MNTHRIIIPAIVAMIDDEMVATHFDNDENTPINERLFDVIMARFDALQKHRAGITNIAQAIHSDPALAIKIAEAHVLTTKSILKAAGIPPDPPHITP